MSIYAQIDQYSLSLSDAQNYQSSMELICTTLSTMDDEVAHMVLSNESGN